MKTAVKSRLSDVEKSLGLGQTEFCQKTGISTETYQKMKGTEELRNSTIRKICEGLKANYIWVMTGKGEMFAPSDAQNPYREALISELKDQVEFYKELLRNVTGTKSFLKALNKSAVIREIRPGAVLRSQAA